MKDGHVLSFGVVAAFGHLSPHGVKISIIILTTLSTTQIPEDRKAWAAQLG